MIMKLRLDSDIFEIVKNKDKDVELRLNDEKRKKLHIGDKLIFLKRPEEQEKIEAYVVGLRYFKDFVEASNYYDMKRIYKENCSKEELVEVTKRFYSDEEVKELGVVAIEFKKSE